MDRRRYACIQTPNGLCHEDIIGLLLSLSQPSHHTSNYLLPEAICTTSAWTYPPSFWNPVRPYRHKSTSVDIGCPARLLVSSTLNDPSSVDNIIIVFRCFHTLWANTVLEMLLLLIPKRDAIYCTSASFPDARHVHTFLPLSRVCLLARARRLESHPQKAGSDAHRLLEQNAGHSS